MRRALPLISTLLLLSSAGCPRATESAPHVEGPKVTPPDRAVVAPGPCVEPEVDARRRLGSDAGPGGVKVARTVDLDGDGVLDLSVTHESFCGTGGCQWHVFLVRGGCGHWVGELFGLAPASRTASSHGLLELEIATRDGCGGLARTEARARFDGRAYATYAKRRCRCPTESGEPEPDPENVCEAWSEARGDAAGNDPFGAPAP